MQINCPIKTMTEKCKEKKEQKETLKVYVQVQSRRGGKCYSHIVLQREWDQFAQPRW